MLIHDPQLIRATRLIIAIIADIITCHLIHIPMSGWVVVSTTIVLFDQETIGGTVIRGKLRIGATIIGSAISLLCLYFFADNWYIIWAVFGITSFLCAYFFMGSKKSYLGLLGIVTMAILLIGNGDGDINHAIYRTIDTIIGVTFAMLSILLYHPEYAFKRCHSQVITALDDIADLVDKIQNETDIDNIRNTILPVENRFISDVVSFNKNIVEAKHEMNGMKHPELIELYQQCVLQIQRMYRLLIVIFNYELENQNLNDLQINYILLEVLQIIHKITNKETRYSIEIDYLELDQLIMQIHVPALQRVVQHFAKELKILNHLLHKIELIRK